MIAWREEMSVGVTTLDNDHKMLFSIVNDFERSQTLQHAEITCKKLFAYVSHHFQREEQIQEELGYPHLDSHREEHRRIIEDLRDLIRSSFLPGTRSAVPDRVIPALTRLLQGWIVRHVMQQDMELRDFIRSRRHARQEQDSLLSPRCRAALLDRQGNGSAPATHLRA